MIRFALPLAALLVAAGCQGSGPQSSTGSTPTPAAAPEAKPATAPPTAAPPPAPASGEGYKIAEQAFNLPPSPAAEAGLEALRGWAVAEWEDPGRISQMTLLAKGRSLMCVTTAGGDKGKTAAVLTRDMALAGKGSLRVAAYNPGPTAVQVAAAFWFSEGWVYYESPPQILPAAAWKTLSFDLAAADYKTKSSDWKHTAALWKRDEAKQLALLIFGAGKPASVYFDGLVVDTAPRTAPRPEARPAPKPEPKPAPGPEPKPEPKPAPQVQPPPAPPAAAPAPSPKKEPEFEYPGKG